MKEGLDLALKKSVIGSMAVNIDPQEWDSAHEALRTLLTALGEAHAELMVLPLPRANDRRSAWLAEVRTVTGDMAATADLIERLERYRP